MEGRALGLIAGEGRVPRDFLAAAQERGYRVSAVVFSPEAEEELRPLCPRIARLPLGQPRRLLRFFREEGVEEVGFAGRFDKKLLFRGLKFDLLALKALRRLADRSDETLMRACAETLEREGLRVVKQTDFLSHLCVPSGPLTRRAPRGRLRLDCAYGYRVARQLADADVGQTVVVKEGAVLAVEAIEGTDAAIRRGCELGGPGAVVVKVSRPRQDARFDVPVVGPNTVEVLLQGKAAVLALEAGKTLLLERERALARAKAVGLVVVGWGAEEGSAP